MKKDSIGHSFCGWLLKNMFGGPFFNMRLHQLIRAQWYRKIRFDSIGIYQFHINTHKYLLKIDRTLNGIIYIRPFICTFDLTVAFTFTFTVSLFAFGTWLTLLGARSGFDYENESTQHILQSLDWLIIMDIIKTIQCVSLIESFAFSSSAQSKKWNNSKVLIFYLWHMRREIPHGQNYTCNACALGNVLEFYASPTFLFDVQLFIRFDTFFSI